MDKKIEDYLHLYLGCECLVYDDDNLDKFGYAKLSGTINGANAVFENFAISMRRVKPILRPLSSMTEDEKYQIQFKCQCFILDEKIHPLDYVQPTIRNMADIINECRKLFFDCDGLIESGVSIDKTAGNAN